MIQFTQGDWRVIGKTLVSGANAKHLMSIEEAPGLGHEAKGNLALVAGAASMYQSLKAILAAGAIDSDGDFLLPRESNDEGEEIGPPPSFVMARVALETIESQGVKANSCPKDGRASYASLQQWAKTLSDEQLDVALHEMRSRGAAVAYYSAGEFETMFDGEELEGVDDWMEDNRAALEEAMCESARAFFRNDFDI